MCTPDNLVDSPTAPTHVRLRKRAWRSRQHRIAPHLRTQLIDPMRHDHHLELIDVPVHTRLRQLSRQTPSPPPRQDVSTSSGWLDAAKPPTPPRARGQRASNVTPPSFQHAFAATRRPSRHHASGAVSGANPPGKQPDPKQPNWGTQHQPQTQGRRSRAHTLSSRNGVTHRYPSRHARRRLLTLRRAPRATPTDAGSVAKLLQRGDVESCRPTVKRRRIISAKAQQASSAHGDKVSRHVPRRAADREQAPAKHPDLYDLACVAAEHEHQGVCPWTPATRVQPLQECSGTKLEAVLISGGRSDPMDVSLRRFQELQAQGHQAFYVGNMNTPHGRRQVQHMINVTATTCGQVLLLRDQLDELAVIVVASPYSRLHSAPIPQHTPAQSSPLNPSAISSPQQKCLEPYAVDYGSLPPASTSLLYAQQQCAQGVAPPGTCTAVMAAQAAALDCDSVQGKTQEGQLATELRVCQEGTNLLASGVRELPPGAASEDSW